jgi:hypothetical protein
LGHTEILQRHVSSKKVNNLIIIDQAYLTGRISASGDVKKLMFFDKISSRGHKQGSMFSI